VYLPPSVAPVSDGERVKALYLSPQ